MIEKPTIIVLPDNSELCNRLNQKLKEYEQRLQLSHSENPYLPPEAFPSWYAIYILSALLKHGQIDTWDLSRKIAQQLNENSKYLKYFENYCGVIEDYIETGGSNLSRGTGLSRNNSIV